MLVDLYLKEEDCSAVLWAECGGHHPAVLLCRTWQCLVVDVRIGYSGNLMYIGK